MRVLLPWSGHCSSDSDSLSSTASTLEDSSTAPQNDYQLPNETCQATATSLADSNRELPKAIFVKTAELSKAEFPENVHCRKAPDALTTVVRPAKAQTEFPASKKTTKRRSEEKSPQGSHQLVASSKKRLRSKPEPTMAIAGRFNNDADEEPQGVLENTPARIWIQPVENSPPPPLNESPAVATDPALDERKQPPSLDIFREVLKRQGLEMVEQEGDGNCLFRAVSLQVYGTADSHAELRERCMDFMSNNEEHYKNFVQGNFAEYIRRKRANGVHGNHAEIQAISELYKYVVVFLL